MSIGAADGAAVILDTNFGEIDLKPDFKRTDAYRIFILIRLAEGGEPQAETRLPCLHQQGTSNALIDGSEKPLSTARRHTERER